MTLDLQFDVLNDTPATASPVESNFNRIETHVNQELISRDGAVAMTAQLRLVGDPVADLDAAPKQYVDAVMPIGIIMMYGGSLAPPGGKWALCNGASLATAAFPGLFGIIGHTYGGAGGSFSLPNFAGRFAVGSSAAAPVIPLGSTGGTKDAVVPTHTHPVDHDHGAATTSTESLNHTHAGVDHLHGVNINSGTVSAFHNHFANYGQVLRHAPFAVIDNVNVWGVRIGDGIQLVVEGVNTNANATGIENQNHFHGVNGSSGAADRSLTTGGVSANHTHGIDLPPFAGSSGAASGGVAGTDQNMPPYQAVTHIIRVL